MNQHSNMPVVLALTLFVVSCSLGPSVIRGAVVMRTATEAHINLGSEDGIQAGDTLAVWRDESRGKSATRNINVGEVTVTKVIDKNYSAVEVLRGTLYERDIVETKAR